MYVAQKSNILYDLTQWVSTWFEMYFKHFLRKKEIKISEFFQIATIVASVLTLTKEGAEAERGRSDIL